MSPIWPQLPPPPQVCTGVSARWCPLHGDCTCAALDPDPTFYARDHVIVRLDATSRDRALNDPSCPLHAPDSPHAETS